MGERPESFFRLCLPSSRKLIGGVSGLYRFLSLVSLARSLDHLKNTGTN